MNEVERGLTYESAMRVSVPDDRFFGSSMVESPMRGMRLAASAAPTRKGENDEVMSPAYQVSGPGRIGDGRVRRLRTIAARRQRVVESATMTRTHLVAIIAAGVIGVLVTIVLVIASAPVPERQGTAPSVVTQSTGAEAQPVGTTTDAREVEASSNTSRGVRGSGVEGVTSAGTTHDSPGAR